jgi:hypothetical protein
MLQISEDFGKTWIDVAEISWMDFGFERLKRAYEKAGYATRYIREEVAISPLFKPQSP